MIGLLKLKSSKNLSITTHFSLSLSIIMRRKYNPKFILNHKQTFVRAKLNVIW